MATYAIYMQWHTTAKIKTPKSIVKVNFKQFNCHRLYTAVVYFTFSTGYSARTLGNIFDCRVRNPDTYYSYSCNITKFNITSNLTRLY